MNNRLVEIFLDLIKIEGTSGQEKKVAEFIFNFLNELGFGPEYDNSKNLTLSNTDNIICKVGNGGSLLLQSHMDTARSTLNVEPKVDKKKIFSGGATPLGVDNRAGITILLYLAEKIAKEKIPVNDFTFAFTTCEETSLAGSKNLGVNGSIKSAFVFDSYLDPGFFVSTGLGAVSFKIEVTGKAAHSGISPEDGINAVSAAVGALSKCKTGRIDSETTINFGTIQGGSAINVVPDHVIIEGEIRSSNINLILENLKKIEAEFASASEKIKASYSLNFNWDFKPYQIDETEYLYSSIESAIEKAGLQPKPAKSWGGSDANTLNERGIKAVNIGIGAKNPHSNDEYILIDHLIKSFEIALALVKK